MLRPAIALFIFICSSAVAGELSDEKLQEIEAIDYRGIGFSSNLQDLLKALPGNGRVSQGVATYEIRDDESNDCVLMRFADDELVEIDFIYFPSRVSSKGGGAILTSRALEKFGTPTRQEDKTLLWDFPTIDRIVVSSYEDGKWSLHIYHRTRRLGIPDYKDASVTPKASRIQITVGPMVPAGYTSRRHGNAPRSVIEPINMVAITRNARNDHPDDYSTQEYVIGNQVQAYKKLKNLICPRGMTAHDFKNLKDTVAKDHPVDYSTQVYVLKNQLKSYTRLIMSDKPSGISARATTTNKATITIPRSTREKIRRNAKQDAKATNVLNRAKPITEIGVGTMPMLHVVVYLSLLVIYFFPSIIASSRGHKNREPIIAVNIFLGWTFIGWAIAFVWALTHQEPAEKPKPTNKQSGQSMLEVTMAANPKQTFGDVMAEKSHPIQSSGDC